MARKAISYVALTMLSLEKISKKFTTLSTSRVIADNLSLDVQEDQMLALVGPSGSGKSTIGRILLGLESPDSGRVLLDGTDIYNGRGERNHQYRRIIQMVPQHPDAAFNPKRTVGAALQEVFRFHTVCDRKDQEQYLLSSLAHVQIHRQLLNRYPSELSGGELQRLAIARSILTKPRFLVLDEITSMLDVSVQATVISTLLALRKEHTMGYLFITHNLKLAEAFCDRILRLNGGRLKSVS